MLTVRQFPLDLIFLLIFNLKRMLIFFPVISHRFWFASPLREKWHQIFFSRDSHTYEWVLLTEYTTLFSSIGSFAFWHATGIRECPNHTPSKVQTEEVDPQAGIKHTFQRNNREILYQFVKKKKKRLK